jgi:hypothetical protein
VLLQREEVDFLIRLKLVDALCRGNVAERESVSEPSRLLAISVFKILLSTSTNRKRSVVLPFALRFNSSTLIAARCEAWGSAGVGGAPTEYVVRDVKWGEKLVWIFLRRYRCLLRDRARRLSSRNFFLYARRSEGSRPTMGISRRFPQSALFPLPIRFSALPDYR